MAKIVMTVWDDFKDGNAVVKCRIVSEGVPKPVTETLWQSTPAMLFMTTVSRLWDRHVIEAHLPAYAPDLIQMNHQIQAMQQGQQQGQLQPPATPAAGLGPQPDVEDAVELPLPGTENISPPASPDADGAAEPRVVAGVMGEMKPGAGLKGLLQNVNGEAVVSPEPAV